jgi:hypothetical protein
VRELLPQPNLSPSLLDQEISRSRPENASAWR